MNWELVATPQAVDAAERILEAWLSPWSLADDQTCADEMTSALGEIASDDAFDMNTLICALTIASIALKDLAAGTTPYEPGHRGAVAAVRLGALILRRIGDSGGEATGVREPRSPRPGSPSTGALPPEGE